MSKIRDILFQPLVSKKEIIDTFGDEMGQIIIEERIIVFYRYGLPAGAFIGVLILFVFMFVRQFGVYFNAW